MTKEETEAYRRAGFRSATVGMRAYKIATSLAQAGIRRGIDWRGCTKRQIEDDFAIDGLPLSHLSCRELREAMKIGIRK